MPLYFFCYRRDGRFAGAVLIEAHVLVEIGLNAMLAGPGEGFECEALELSSAVRSQIPTSMVGHVLSLEELGQLESILTPKKPAAASVPREPPKRSFAK